MNNQYPREDWIENIIKCFDYALDENNNFPTDGAVYNDLLNTIGLLYECFINKKDWAYFELSEKYKTVPLPEQVGKALKIISERIRNFNAEEEPVEYGSNSNNIIIDDLIDILNKQSMKWNDIFNDSNIYQYKSDDISALKKRIKYCKNPMEKKKLEQELNLLYKKRKRNNSGKEIDLFSVC